jgi:hypothetical protein
MGGSEATSLKFFTITAGALPGLRVKAVGTGSSTIALLRKIESKFPTALKEPPGHFIVSASKRLLGRCEHSP